MKKHLLAFVLIVFSHLAYATVSFVEVEDFTTWEQMIALAKAKNLNLLVQVVPMPCYDCKQLKKDLFKNKEINSEVNQNYLAIKVLSLSEVGKALTSLFAPQDASTLLILNTDEVLFYKHSGLISADAFLVELKTNDGKIAHYKNWQLGASKGDLEKLDWVSFMLIEDLNGRVNPTSSIVRDVSSLLDSTDFGNPEVQKFVSTLGIDVDNPIFQTLKKRPDFIQESTFFTWPEYYQRVFDYNIARAIAGQDSIFLEDVLFQLSQLPTDSSVSNMSLKGRQLYLAELAKWNAYDTITMTYLQSFNVDSANMYQAEAMFLMENYPQTKPQELALKYLRLGLQQKETFKLYYTLALYLFNSGDMINAYKSASMAYSKAQGVEEAKLAARLRDMIALYY